MKRLTRRQFLRTGAAGVALPWIVPASVLGAEAPSNRITIGFIGTGDHGTTWNLQRYLQLKAARVVVVCDVDGYRMRRAKAMVDAEYDNEDCAITKDFREVIARKDIIYPKIEFLCRQMLRPSFCSTRRQPPGLIVEHLRGEKIIFKVDNCLALFRREHLRPLRVSKRCVIRLAR